MNVAPLDSLLATAREYNASDLHIIAGVPPAFRVNGEIILAESDTLMESDVDEIAFQILNEVQRELRSPAACSPAWPSAWSMACSSRA